VKSSTKKRDEEREKGGGYRGKEIGGESEKKGTASMKGKRSYKISHRGDTNTAPA